MSEKRGSTVYHYQYDSYGNIARISYEDGTSIPTYYPVCNARGDVDAIYNSAGTLVARYIYDAWGGIISIQNASGTEITNQDHIAHRNPFRYRGYYYDAETGLYYLQSRYYDPVTSRFINADGEISGIGGDFRGYNLYSYCMNNPVMLSDPNGNWPKLSTILTVVAVVAVVVAVAAVVVVTAGAAAPALAVAGGGIMGGMSAGAIATATTVGMVAAGTAIVAGTAAVVASKVENSNYRGPTRDQTVYKLVQPGSSTPEYVGRTNDPARRAGEHAKSPGKAGLEMVPIATGLTKMEARAMEQVVISAYTLNNLSNARREIAVGNVGGFAGNMNNTIKLFGGLAEDELLNLMGR